jgi:hypothetical protein
MERGIIKAERESAAPSFRAGREINKYILQIRIRASGSEYGGDGE